MSKESVLEPSPGHRTLSRAEREDPAPQQGPAAQPSPRKRSFGGDGNGRCHQMQIQPCQPGFDSSSSTKDRITLPEALLDFNYHHLRGAWRAERRKGWHRPRWVMPESSEWF